jgi:hypothetical protein
MANPVTVPPELIYEWAKDRALLRNPLPLPEYIAARAAQWGADQELEACLRLIEIDAGEDAYDFARYIRAARRPKPSRLKEQALEALAHIATGPDPTAFLDCQDTIRRALEQLPDNE